MVSKNTHMTVENIPLDKIIADDSFNCRGPIAPIDVVDLAKDIEQNGLIQPVVVCPNSDGTYKLIAGFRRYTAHKVLERDTIPCNVRDDAMNEADARIFNLAENIKRQDLNVLQEARALVKLKDLGVTDQSVAERLGKSRTWVTIRYNLLDLPHDIQVHAGMGVFTQPQIRDLWQIQHNSGNEAVYEAAKRIKAGQLKGLKIDVNPNRSKPASRVHRKRGEIFLMMEHIQSCGIGNGLWTQCLAWCAGEISNHELYLGLSEQADQMGINYSIPEELAV